MMIGIKCVVFVVVLTFLQSPARGDVQVSCVFMQRCILPCSFQANAGLLIHWMKAENTPVHSYSRNQDQLAHQGQRFKGRTSMFKDQISGGNASLRLTRVEIQDQGRYKCYTSTISGQEESYINLKVDDSSPNVPAIIGGVIGAVVVLAVIVGLVAFCIYPRNTQCDGHQPAPQEMDVLNQRTGNGGGATPT